MASTKTTVIRVAVEEMLRMLMLNVVEFAISEWTVFDDIMTRRMQGDVGWHGP
jgi:hypothetical protein